ncbi:MAG: glycosyltransferase family 9 protein [Chlorobi bacterium]|nr:glycosyltransferase family 9 protein [Chlorobiota bacterium]
MSHLLVFRFSAMGDVALTVPVLKSVLEQYPELQITLITRKTFVPLFSGIQRLEVIPADFSGKHRGLTGLFTFFRENRQGRTFTAVIDLHDVLRTKVLDFLFRMKGLKVYRIDKGRKEKRDLIHGKNVIPLVKTVDRYFSVFEKAGFAAKLGSASFFHFPAEQKREEGKPDKIIRIGIAPCAKHPLKEWPVDKIIALMYLLRKNLRVRFYLFGGKDEAERLTKIAEAVPETSHEVPDLSLSAQLMMMGKMKLMISMDSANMHLAALAGIPLVVIWGATHPYAGFVPVGNHEKGFVQISREKLDCRPCTVYGKGTCRRGDHACMARITPEMVYAKILALKIPEISA